MKTIASHTFTDAAGETQIIELLNNSLYRIPAIVNGGKPFSVNGKDFQEVQTYWEEKRALYLEIQGR